MFLEYQISILEGFLKDYETLKTGVMILKTQTENSWIYISIIVHNITVLLYFKWNKLVSKKHFFKYTLKYSRLLNCHATVSFILYYMD